MQEPLCCPHPRQTEGCPKPQDTGVSLTRPCNLAVIMTLADGALNHTSWLLKRSLSRIGRLISPDAPFLKPVTKILRESKQYQESSKANRFYGRSLGVEDTMPRKVEGENGYGSVQSKAEMEAPGDPSDRRWHEQPAVTAPSRPGRSEAFCLLLGAARIRW